MCVNVRVCVSVCVFVCACVCVCVSVCVSVDALSCARAGCRSHPRGLDAEEHKYLGKLLVFLRATRGYDQAINYISSLIRPIASGTLEPVSFLRNAPTVRVRQRPVDPPGPENFNPHKLRVVFKRKRDGVV